MTKTIKKPYFCSAKIISLEHMYKVSVVTPFHNVELSVFEKAYQSMKSQTIGFENIQWIVIAHNCEPHYLPALQEMLGQHDNVIVRGLDNDARTPSSPRNYGMQFATAPYIGFLDADDSYTVHCLEEVYNNIKETKSDVLIFRRESELEDPSLVPLIELVGWNQLEPRIIVERDNWDEEKMFLGVGWGIVTSKVFDREFLNRNNITFDEEVPFAESTLFSVQSIGLAQRICYLTQMIGYHYYINSGSLVQSAKKSGDTLVSYAKGYVKLFSCMENYGIQSPHLFWVLLNYLANFMLASADQLTLDDRLKIKAYLAPFILRAEPFHSAKGISEDFAETVARTAIDVMMNTDGKITDFIRDASDGHLRLMTILRINKNTDYGERYSFASIRSIKGFQHRVPITTYADYEKLIRLQTNIGEENIITAEEIEQYAMNLEGHLFPMTRVHLRPYRRAISNVMRGHNNLPLLFSQPIAKTSFDNNFIERFQNRTAIDFITTSLSANWQNHSNLSIPAIFLSSAEQDINTKRFLLICRALLSRDVDQIIALNTLEVLTMFTTLEQQWRNFISEIEQYDEERAHDLAEVFKQGFDDIAVRIWPKLKRIVAFGAGKYQFHTATLKRYTKSTTHNHGHLLTIESIIAQAIADDSDLFELYLENDFFEFMPDNSEPLLLSEVSPGMPCEVIVTNRAGLYRYRTGIRISVVEHTQQGNAIIRILE